MKFKVDENLPAEWVLLLRNEPHDAVSVNDQNLGGLQQHLALSVA